LIKKKRVPVGVVSSGPAISIVSLSFSTDKDFHLFQSDTHFYSLVAVVLE
jgi:hypothetical protein